MEHLKPNQIANYLNSDLIDGAKWSTYMMGYLSLTPEDVENMSVPELDILMYCNQKRIKMDSDKLQIMGGGAYG
ncbi:hypothetical protein [Apilactobacillus micheneri]|uniref:hypothetical protein n=1 Tax=Apilactobacillus micheneri TaxID=1899430 RepID=UPI000D029DA2|nr:hypothetical protein [Apilactobacillus micheneri]